MSDFASVPEENCWKVILIDAERNLRLDMLFI